MECSACHSQNPDGAKFCAECGATLGRRCASCGLVASANAKFCTGCGAAIGAAAKPPEQAAATGERRHLTILFCDLVGSTEIAAGLDPEEWHAIAASYQRAAAEAVTRFGGHVLKFLGDGLVVCFGFPKAMEDAAERAVRAGLAIVEATAQVARPDGRPAGLHVRVGIHSGAVVVAQGGGSEADMFGDAPNVAARVQTAAPADSVVISQTTHNLVSGLFVVESLGAPQLKGVAQPLQLHRVLGAGLAHRRSFAARTLAPFVGRSDEMQTLARRWERVRDGEGQLALLSGEPGIGKSRLIEEFHAHIKSDTHLWVACACQELFSGTPLQPVTQMLDQGLGWHGDESQEERLAGLERALRASGVRLDDGLPLIAELLGLPVADSPVFHLSAELKRRRLFAALSGWVFGAAKLQNLVIVVEDLHWADPSTMEWLHILADQSAGSPVLVLCTARPEFRAPWPLRAHHTQLTLNRLNDRQTREMVSGLAAQSGLAGDVLENLVRRTDGVPLFAEELTRLMFDTAQRPDAREIPATLHDSLNARLDRLGGDARDVAQTGSAIGREFAYDLIAAVSTLDETRLQAALAELAGADLVLARGFPPDSTYQFKHALIQDAAYDTMLRSRRGALHGRIAESIEAAFPELAEAQPQLLARHLALAGRTDKAIEAWLKAARFSDTRGALREAETAYREALALATALPQSAERDAREVEILTPLIVIVASLRGWGTRDAQALSTRAAELTERAGNLMQLILQRFAALVTSASGGELARSRVQADQLFDLCRREGSDFSLRCGHEAQLIARYPTADFAGAEEHYESWRAVCDRAGYGPFPSETPTMFCTAAHNAWHRGFSDTAARRLEQAVAQARQAANPIDLATAFDQMALNYVIQRNPAQVHRAASEGLALAEKHGITKLVVALRARLAWANAFLEQRSDSAEIYRRSIADMVASEGERAANDAHLRFGQVLAVTGRNEEALVEIERYLEDTEAIVARPNALHLRGELQRRLGRTAEAEAGFREALALASRIGTKFVELRAATSLGRLLHARGDTAAARALVAPLYAAFTEGFDTADMTEAKAFLDEIGAR